MDEATNNTIAPWRLNLLRVGYLIIAGGLSFAVWPTLLDPALSWPLNSGVVKTMLASFSLLALLGLRYPLQLLPILFWELGWKVIWMIRIAWPQWSAGTLDHATEQTLYEVMPILLYLAIIPWDHVWSTYAKQSANPWRSPG